MLNRIYAVDSVTLTTSGSAVSSYMPFDMSTRKLPTQVVLRATGNGAYVRLSDDNSAATNVDILVQAGDHAVVSVQGRHWVSVLNVSGSSTVSIEALSTGVSGSASTLDLQFAGATALDSRITFTRASSASYYDSTGILRLAPVNLLTYSEQFNNAAWVKNATTVAANAIAAPDGSLTADKLVENTATSQHTLAQAYATTNLTIYTYSVYAKAGGWPSFTLQMGSGGILGIFDFSTEIATGGNGATAATMSSVGNGWYRCTVTGPSNGNSTNFIFKNGGSYTGDGTSGVYLWGAQLEPSTTASTYSPTTGTGTGAPRFDYDPLTHQPQGLLIEEARTNSLTHSSGFTNAVWTGTNVTLTANATTAPDGTATAASIVPTTASGSHIFTNATTVAVSIGNTFSASVYVKPNGYNYVGLALGNVCFAGEVLAVFNVKTGQLTASDNGTSATLQSYSSTNVGGGWWRVSITSTAVAVDTGVSVRVYVSNDGTANASSGGVPSYAGDGASGIYIWGAQLEAGAFPTSYIPTTTAAAPRAADSAVISTLTPWYNATAGSILTNSVPITVNTGSPRGVFGLSDGSSANSISFFSMASGSVSKFEIATASAFQATFTLAYSSKNAAAYELNNVNMSSGGVLGTTDTSATMPTVTSAQIGDIYGSGVYKFNGWISAITYYPRRLSDVALQAITA